MASGKDDYRMEESSITGGKVFNDPKEGEMLRRSLQYLAQRVGSQVLSGNVNFTRMSMPVHLNEPRSLLERITDDWAYASLYLTAAARTEDPILRMKQIAAFVVSGLHCMETLGKPFNPILGSTYHAVLDDGAQCYVEQTSHHPPVTHYLIQPESGEYHLAGFSGIDGKVVWGLDTGLSSRRIGMNVVQFADGTRIVYNLPRMLVRGLATERKCEYLGPFSLFYEEHNLVFDFLLDPPQPFRWSPFRARTPSDYMDGVLYRLSADAVVAEGATVFTGAFKEREGAYFGNPDGCKLAAEEGGYTAIELRSDEQVAASVTSAIQERDQAGSVVGVIERDIVAYARGSFVGYLDIDGDRVWDIRETRKGGPVAGDLERALRSDCRFREDIVELRRALDEENDEETKAGLMHNAQTLKEKLENIQRNDRKLRAAGVVLERSREQGDGEAGGKAGEEAGGGEQDGVEGGIGESLGSNAKSRVRIGEENCANSERVGGGGGGDKFAGQTFFPKSLGGI
eukprot:GFKZ01012746.1.p1 GENE.GFKZ01012746.1~~GFKZ01012746.1.p1  ORF type:complete len:512 (+),score=81.39 GFKZ01012746.1:172-1707(+)